MPFPARFRPLFAAARGRYVRAGARLEAWLRAAARVRVLHPRTLADRALARRLARAFERAPAGADAAGVRFFVYNGTVALHGTAPDAPALERLAALARGVRGVRGVISHMRVADAPGATSSERPGA